MAFDEKLNDRIRESLENIPNVEEKEMFGGTCYMVNGKMCVGVVKDKMTGYVYVQQEGIRTKAEFQYWINLCLAFNSLAKSSKKKAK
jgi:hypothetical protein